MRMCEDDWSSCTTPPLRFTGFRDQKRKLSLVAPTNLSQLFWWYCHSLEQENEKPTGHFLIPTVFQVVL
jgi:hypothetical protein